MKKRMYLIKREVWATSLEKALKTRGRVYEVIETDKPPEENKNVGFNNKKNK